MAHQIQNHVKNLRLMCAIWKSKTDGIPASRTLADGWGPSEHELGHAAVAATSGMWYTKCNGDDSESDVDNQDDEIAEVDAELVEQLETQAVVDSYRYGSDGMDVGNVDSRDDNLHRVVSQYSRSPSKSPWKRSRRDSE